MLFLAGEERDEDIQNQARVSVLVGGDGVIDEQADGGRSLGGVVALEETECVGDAGDLELVALPLETFRGPFPFLDRFVCAVSFRAPSQVREDHTDDTEKAAKGQ